MGPHTNRPEPRRPDPAWRRLAPAERHPDRCTSTAAGHRASWIPYLRPHAEPMTGVRIGDLGGDGWFCLTDGTFSEWWWWHDPVQLRIDVGDVGHRLIRIGGDLAIPIVPRRPGWHQRLVIAREAGPCDIET